MNKKVKIILMTVIIILGVLLVNQLKYRSDELYAVNLKNKIDKDLISILVSDGSNNYTKYEGDTFPSNTEYTFNSETSKCQDNNGNVINGVLSYDETNGKVNIRTKKTAYCYLYFDKISGVKIVGNIAQGLINSNTLWQSGLEGDGYRYTGTRVTCSYDNGKYIGIADNQDTTPSCPKLYNYTETRISNGSTYNYTYKTSCPSNTSTYTYSCTELLGTLNSESINTVPNNFICFGTNNLSECKANEDKYMYRIIGVFPDADGSQHLKLIKHKQLGEYKWHDIAYEEDVTLKWSTSDLYKGLNGISGGIYNNLFIGNTTYDYLQDTTWLNKIANWKWTATSTYTGSRGPYYDSITTEQMYLHEMNRSTKVNSYGEWTYPEAKIGLMYVTDYMMSLGSSSLTMTSQNDNSTLKTGWLNKAQSFAEWSMTSANYNDEGDGLYFFSWGLVNTGAIYSYGSLSTFSVSPVFYLTSDAIALGGTGSYNNPYLIQE